MSGTAINHVELTALQNLKKKWAELPTGNLLETYVLDGINTGSYVSVLYYKHGSLEYGWALLLSYIFPRPVYITFKAGVWDDAIRI